MPSSLGSKTRSKITFGPESHKLYLEFTPDGTIEQGTPVILDATTPGTVKPAGAAALHNTIIGYSITGGNKTAYSQAGAPLVTIACKGFMVIQAKASVDTDPGPVELVGYDADGNVKVKASTDATKQIGWAITGAVADADIEVMLS